MEVSLTGKRWRERGTSVSLLPHELTRGLTLLRGVTDSPKLHASQFTQFEAFKRRMTDAAARRETVGIFGDYDCDGVTSTALMVRHFRRRGMEPVVRLPHRVHDGYGIREKHVQEFADAGVTLLITVDTGIGAPAAIARAREAGMDVCIVDHHHAPPSPPVATAIIHPAYAQGVHDAPSAATICFALIDALEGGAWEGCETDIALGMLGTVADVMPLTGANRTLVLEGLRALDSLTEGPLFALRKGANIEGVCTARDVAFRIAPRINAAGRMNDPVLALRALLDGGEALAALERLNVERQDHVEDLRSALWNTLGIGDETLPSALPPLLFAVSDAYTPGIVGLLAGKLTERTGRPSLVGCVTGDTVTASLRSPPGYHVTQGLERAAEFLLEFGGHAQAAGCAFRLANAPALERALCADVTAQVAAESLVPWLEYDAVLEEPHTLTTDAVRTLSSLEPFGAGNPEPRFLLPGITLSQVRAVGADGSHLQARIGDVPVVGFRFARHAAHAKAPLDILCRLSLNTWNGRTTAQCIVEDLRIAA